MNFIIPMEPVASDEIKQGDGFIHEIKWDGIRGMTYVKDGSLRIFTKKGNERTEFYPELKQLETMIGKQNAVLDGEMIVLDGSGQPGFHNILLRETVKNRKNLQHYLKNYPVRYVIFDILMLEDKMLTKKPLHERKEILERVIAPKLQGNSSFFVSQVFENGVELYENMKLRNMEGIVSKSRSSLYLPGKKHNEWFKTKFTKKMLCIIGGILWKEELPNSLVMGIRTEESSGLVYMGKASLGLKGADILLLKNYKGRLVQKECPFTGDSIRNMDSQGCELTWISPALTCWVGFLELSNDGHFRHPKILGFTNIPPDKADGKVLTE
ncbi:hypothetical protein CLHUN_07810 [Ruminiclostridium hungatei]|uniref:DNA ligase (ATP) n=1 Tax=Ruminiclostridium hungatei TaxID=48256 RepID=A0A1V4SQ67_RUMHU|nr:RNA ligase family protein [Ruminiclostridium hungatei]OPX45411.1 hypothetical protein CLHUN_07810 [Ruminiclostridium hungatei]